MSWKKSYYLNRIHKILLDVMNLEFFSHKTFKEFLFKIDHDKWIPSDQWTFLWLVEFKKPIMREI